MRETFPVKLLMRLLQATPKQLMVIERILDGQALADWEKGGSGSLAAQSLEEGSLQGGSKAGSRWVFRRAGRHWEVVFGSNKAFYLNDMLAARCADYLLHHPNDPIAAFDLEVVVQAEKGAARARNSIQADSDDEPCASTGRS